MSPSNSILQKGRAKRLADEQQDAPWAALRAEVFPSARQKFVFAFFLAISLVIAIYESVQDFGTPGQPLAIYFVVTVSNLIAVIFHAQKQKAALMKIIKSEAPELHRKLIIETV